MSRSYAAIRAKEKEEDIERMVIFSSGIRNAVNSGKLQINHRPRCLTYRYIQFSSFEDAIHAISLRLQSESNVEA